MAVPMTEPSNGRTLNSPLICTDELLLQARCRISTSKLAATAASSSSPVQGQQPLRAFFCNEGNCATGSAEARVPR
jgi:hypothetical protein